MTTSTDRVFETYELLEHIIVAIESPFKIFVIQRVRSTWRAIIERSAAIQKILFTGPAHNPLAPGKPNTSLFFKTHVTYTEHLRLNDFVPQYEVASGSYSNKREKLIDVSLYFLYQGASAPPAVAESWRKVFLTHPPCTTIWLISMGSASEKSYNVQMTVRDEGGITLGLLDDLMRNVATQGDTKEGKPVKFCVSLSAPETAQLLEIKAGWQRWCEEERERRINARNTSAAIWR